MLKVYHASAGSGKTFRLTQDYIRLLFASDTPNAHRKILAVTFTNKATGEMKFRIIQELNTLAKGEPSPYRDDLCKSYRLTADTVNEKARDILIRILHDYPAFSISTIDRFFQQIIRAFARDIGVHGGYALELDSNSILDQAVDNLFLDLTEKENAQLLEWLTIYAEEKIENAENWNLRGNIIELGKEIFKENYQHKAAQTHEKLHDKDFLKNYRKQLQQIRTDFRQEAARLANKVLNILDEYSLETIDFKGGSRTSMNTLHKIVAGDYELKPTFLEMTRDVTKCMTKTTPAETQEAIYAAWNGGLEASFGVLTDYINTHILFYNTAAIVLKHLSTLGILSDLSIQIRKLTADQNIMLIADSNLLLNKIIDDSDSPFIYEKTGIYLDHFMIDEFQDTSLLQWRNFLPLVSNSLSAGFYNMLVGDVKQSIYRWRNSDWNLLDSQVYRDFDPALMQDETLGTNWRSDRNIIHFNNALFERAMLLLQNQLNEQLEPVLAQLPELDALQTRIIHAYRGMRQEPSTKAGEGHVSVRFIDDKEEDEGWKEIALTRLPAMLEELQDRGYSPNDIAVLVRTNQEEKSVIQKLLHYKTTPEARAGYSYDIMGTEGLMLESSATLRFLLGVLQLLIRPEDEVQRTIVNYEYLVGRQKQSPNEALKGAMVGTDNTDSAVVSPLFTELETKGLNELRQQSLYEMTEGIIALFDLRNWHAEVVFLQAFQDLIYQFSTGKSTDLNAFLKWWEKSGGKQFIATPENDRAFRIMTVHKSKGLDFKVVVMPFCDWKLDNNMRNILWCETAVEPFSQLPVLPVEYSAGLGKTIFAAQYYREMMHNYIDNLNIAYVAFTRAKHELIVMAPIPSEKSKNEGSTKSMAQLIYHSFNSSDDTFLTDHFEAEKPEFTVGTPEKKTAETKTVSTSDRVLDDYPVVAIGDRLRIKHRIGKINRDEVSVTETPIDYGNLMHELLSSIDRPADSRNLIQQFVREGRIRQGDVANIEREMEAFWQLPLTMDWFREGRTVLNETTILTPEGMQYRPDRILLDDKRATVIDYKFGENRLPSHRRQLANYASLLSRMGYQTDSYLCYVKLREVVAVNTEAEELITL